MEKDKKSKDDLIKEGWTFVTQILEGSAELWKKDTQKIIWRVKTQTIHLMSKRKEGNI